MRPRTGSDAINQGRRGLSSSAATGVAAAGAVIALVLAIFAPSGKGWPLPGAPAR